MQTTITSTRSSFSIAQLSTLIRDPDPRVRDQAQHEAPAQDNAPPPPPANKDAKSEPAAPARKRPAKPGARAS